MFHLTYQKSIFTIWRIFKTLTVRKLGTEYLSLECLPKGEVHVILPLSGKHYHYLDLLLSIVCIISRNLWKVHVCRCDIFMFVSFVPFILSWLANKFQITSTASSVFTFLFYIPVIVFLFMQLIVIGWFWRIRKNFQD